MITVERALEALKAIDTPESMELRMDLACAPYWNVPVSHSDYRRILAIVKPHCEYCNKFPGGPDHFAMQSCRSGKRNHCTCDTCF